MTIETHGGLTPQLIGDVPSPCQCSKSLRLTSSMLLPAGNLAQQGSWARKDPSPARRGQLG